MYSIKFWEEAGWAVLIAVVVSLLQVLIDFDPAKIVDFRVWAISLGAGAVRAAAIALLAWVGKAKMAP